jgi:hypothetical protein
MPITLGQSASRKESGPAITRLVQVGLWEVWQGRYRETPMESGIFRAPIWFLKLWHYAPVLIHSVPI